ncbi:MAG TPA: ABC transporter permease [Streptomyces sp.]|nr:ABC transporter permease [Streptomyces sp.]
MTRLTEVSRRPDVTGGPHDSPAPARARGPHGLLWLTLRVHRASLLGWAAFAAVATAGLFYLYDIVETADRWKGCGGPGRPRCPDVDQETLFLLFTTVITYLPFAVALYAGGVLVGRDLENDTAAFAWTQSVTPARWLAAKLAVPAVLIMATTALLTLLQRRVWSVGNLDQFEPWQFNDVFHATGVIGLAYTVLALALGALAGLLVRRTLPAMGLAVAALLPVYLTFSAYRHELWPKVFKTGHEAARVNYGVALNDTGFIMDSGARVSDSSCYVPGTSADLAKCLDAHGAKDLFVEFHPDSHYWPIQFVESGIVLALAAVALWVAFRLLRKKTATDQKAREHNPDATGPHTGRATTTSSQEAAV